MFCISVFENCFKIPLKVIQTFWNLLCVWFLPNCHFNSKYRSFSLFIFLAYNTNCRGVLLFVSQKVFGYGLHLHPWKISKLWNHYGKFYDELLAPSLWPTSMTVQSQSVNHLTVRSVITTACDALDSSGGLQCGIQVPRMSREGIFHSRQKFSKPGCPCVSQQMSGSGE